MQIYVANGISCIWPSYLSVLACYSIIQLTKRGDNTNSAIKSCQIMVITHDKFELLDELKPQKRKFSCDFRNTLDIIPNKGYYCILSQLRLILGTSFYGWTLCFVTQNAPNSDSHSDRLIIFQYEWFKVLVADKTIKSRKLTRNLSALFLSFCSNGFKSNQCFIDEDTCSQRFL